MELQQLINKLSTTNLINNYFDNSSTDLREKRPKFSDSIVFKVIILSTFYSTQIFFGLWTKVVTVSDFPSRTTIWENNTVLYH